MASSCAARQPGGDYSFNNLAAHFGDDVSMPNRRRRQERNLRWRSIEPCASTRPRVGKATMRERSRC